MQSSLLKPDLYKAEGTEAAPEAPALLGAECSGCGYVFFPAQSFGCERCGAHGEAIKPRMLSGRGTLAASAIAHLHAGKRATPFTIGAIRLEDGPLVRTLLVGSGSFAPGQAMRARLVAEADPETGEAKLDLRFSPAE